ncbi:hypothetical protein D3C81_1551810 [compost metagenome]
MRDPLAKGKQYRTRSFQVGSLAADHDRQAAGLGARRATGDGCIQPRHATQGGQFGSHLASGGRLKAGQVDQQLPATPALGDALLAENHLTYHRRIGQAQQHHVAATAQLGRIGSQPRASRDQLGTLFRAAVPDGQRVTCGQQAPAHRQPHQTNPGESKRRQFSAHNVSWQIR